MANETILVTGATGQVGRRLVPRLLSWREPGDAVRVLVRTREAAGRFEALGAQAVVGDITAAADRKRALDGVALVVNTAATFRDPGVAESDMYAVNRDAAVALARRRPVAGRRTEAEHAHPLDNSGGPVMAAGTLQVVKKRRSPSQIAREALIAHATLRSPIAVAADTRR